LEEPELSVEESDPDELFEPLELLDEPSVLLDEPLLLDGSSGQAQQPA
jgi:hypothetical protein